MLGSVVLRVGLVLEHVGDLLAGVAGEVGAGRQTGLGVEDPAHRDVLVDLSVDLRRRLDQATERGVGHVHDVAQDAQGRQGRAVRLVRQDVAAGERLRDRVRAAVGADVRCVRDLVAQRGAVTQTRERDHVVVADEDDVVGTDALSGARRLDVPHEVVDARHDAVGGRHRTGVTREGRVGLINGGVGASLDRQDVAVHLGPAGQRLEVVQDLLLSDRVGLRAGVVVAVQVPEAIGVDQEEGLRTCWEGRAGVQHPRVLACRRGLAFAVEREGRSLAGAGVGLSLDRVRQHVRVIAGAPGEVADLDRQPVRHVGLLDGRAHDLRVVGAVRREAAHRERRGVEVRHALEALAVQHVAGRQAALLVADRTALEWTTLQRRRREARLGGAVHHEVVVDAGGRRLVAVAEHDRDERADVRLRQRDVVDVHVVGRGELSEHELVGPERLRVAEGLRTAALRQRDRRRVDRAERVIVVGRDLRRGVEGARGRGRLHLERELQVFRAGHGRATDLSSWSAGPSARRCRSSSGCPRGPSRSPACRCRSSRIP